MTFSQKVARGKELSGRPKEGDPKYQAEEMAKESCGFCLKKDQLENGGHRLSLCCRGEKAMNL